MRTIVLSGCEITHTRTFAFENSSGIQVLPQVLPYPPTM